MNPIVLLTVIPFLFSLIISLVMTPLTVILFTKMGWVIDPKKTPHPAHIHKGPVPKGGGIPIFVAVFFTGAFFFKKDMHLISICIAALLFVVVGFVYDIRGTKTYIRFW